MIRFLAVLIFVGIVGIVVIWTLSPPANPCIKAVRDAHHCVEETP